LVKGGKDKVIVQSHFGIQCSRSGYTPKSKGLVKLWKTDIPFLNQAKYLVDAGYSVLMYDFRNHGNSGAGTREWVAGGQEEYKDVIAAVDFITHHPDYKESKIGLLSISMGAVSAAYAYGIENGLQEYTNIKALIAVQPIGYADFLHAMGVPGFLVSRANKINLKRGGLDFYAACLPNVESINVPTMLVQNKNDPWTSFDYVKNFYDELNAEKEMLWPELAKKHATAYDWIGHNPKEIPRWFGKYMGEVTQSG
jgi:pimeloyl-ACP methyl ester carboxylesterase